MSIELLQNQRKVFSFQIAQRSVQLEPSLQTAWTDVPLDSLADLIASKMVALIERGAPRDFRDLFAACQAGLASPAACWTLWRRRQTAVGSDADEARARLAIATHLERIGQHRPLNQIADPEAQQAAAQLRAWFGGPFLAASDETGEVHGE